MTPNDHISVDELRQWVRYDPETGFLWWVKKPSSKAKMASPAGSLRRDGRINFRLKNKNYKAHRVCWALHYGSWPDKDIDHVNCNPSDNRIQNLRLATKAENNSNMRKKAGCSSRFKGVTWDKGWRCWRAYIRKNGTLHRLGNFSNEEDAHAAYCKAAAEMKGEFARFG